MTTENTESLKSLCAVVPAAMLAVAHWLPWKQMLGRDLHRLEAYAIGTTAIVGTALVAMSQSDGDNEDHMTMLATAAVSAGMGTLAAWAVDALTAEPTR
ncbi:MAG: hypothetical protein IT328_05895 [Caldilineaceae bacterium]|nr:hypothetical protein [Caldilineaceae bacterium]